ncbi:MAG: serine/threonine protein kinase [Myxococcota bacterium]
MYGQNLSALYKPDDVIAGRYRIVRVLGAGGMGVVVAARHQDLDTLVAIKMLRPEVLSNRDVVARFAAEAKAAVRIKSEHVARVTDVGALPDGAPYMVMEYLEGSDLAALVEQSGPLPIEDAVDYVLQACEALTEAHCLGIVHRDLKPGNLFLTRRADGSEIVKVLDFGISKSADGAGASASLTGTGAILGSPTYMSPEQLSSSKTVDRRTDIWALGVILHQIISGQLPFRADTLPELFMAIVQNQPPPLRSLRPDVPPGLAAVVLRCLEKDRTRRFENVGELAVALAPFAPPRSRICVERILRMAPVVLTDSQASQTATAQQGALPGWQWPSKTGSSDTQGTWGNTASKPESSTSRKILMSLGVLVLVIGAGALVKTVWMRDETPGAATSTAAALPVPPPSAIEASLPPSPPPAATNEVPEVARVESVDVTPAAPPKTALAPVPALPRASQRTPARSPSRREPTVNAAVAEPTAPVASPIASPAPRPAASPAPPPPKPRSSDWEEDRH